MKRLILATVLFATILLPLAPHALAAETFSSWPVFWAEEVSYMAASANLDEFHSRNTAESWVDGAEPMNGRRLPHNSRSMEEWAR